MSIKRIRPFDSEAEMAALVVQYVKDLGFEVYQEVAPLWNSCCADIVGKRGPLLWVIECKLVFGLDVIAQARNWLDHAHWVSVATPVRGGFAAQVCRKFGIGALTVTRPHTEYEGRFAHIPHVHEDVEPEFRRRVDDKNFKDALTDYHKTFAQAGNAEGKRWTPFRETCKNVSDYVKEHPGTNLKDLVEGIKHHYSSHAVARQSIPHWIRNKLIEGVRMKLVKGKTLLFPREQKGGANVQ